MPLIAGTLDEALAPITDGCALLVPRETAGVAMEATRALIRRGVKHLALLTLPTSSLQADLLIGAGCVHSIETSAVSLGEFGPAPRFGAAVTGRTVRVKDTTCPAMYARLQAAEKGVPFMPMRGLIGSDLVAHRPDWRVIDNPFGEDDPIVLLPALRADVALFHAPMADRAGNVWIGRERELALMAHAAARTVVTVEKIHDGNLLDDPLLAAGHACRLLRRGGRGRAARRLAVAAARSLSGGRGPPRRVRAARRDTGGLCGLSRPLRARPPRRVISRHCTPVIAGLDPAIHPLGKTLPKKRWMPGSSPGMTIVSDPIYRLIGAKLAGIISELRCAIR